MAEEKQIRVIFFGTRDTMPGMRLEATDEPSVVEMAKNSVRIVMPMDREKLTWMVLRALEFLKWLDEEGPQPESQMEQLPVQ